MQVVVTAGAKGAQVSRVVSVDVSTATAPTRQFDAPRTPRRAAPDPTAGEPLEGKVKWFNETKGFGFVAVDDGGKDVFIHISALKAAGIPRLNDGQPVNMRVVDTPRGREAISISLSNAALRNIIASAERTNLPPPLRERFQNCARAGGGEDGPDVLSGPDAPVRALPIGPGQVGRDEFAGEIVALGAREHRACAADERMRRSYDRVVDRIVLGRACVDQSLRKQCGDEGLLVGAARRDRALGLRQ